MNIFLTQITEQLSHPYSVFFLIAFGLSLFMFHMRSRRRILAVKFTSDINYAVYYFLLGGLSGCLGALIAATGGMVQSMTPDRLMKKTAYFRISGAILLAAAGIYFTSQKTGDALPLIAIILGRFAEISGTPQKIRIGMLATVPLWITYNFNNEFYLLLVANLSVLISLLWAIYKNTRIKIIPEPV